jgi:hypothetical protein
VIPFSFKFNLAGLNCCSLFPHRFFLTPPPGAIQPFFQVLDGYGSSTCRLSTFSDNSSSFIFIATPPPPKSGLTMNIIFRYLNVLIIAAGQLRKFHLL